MAQKNGIYVEHTHCNAAIDKIWGWQWWVIDKLKTWYNCKNFAV